MWSPDGNALFTIRRRPLGSDGMSAVVDLLRMRALVWADGGDTAEEGPVPDALRITSNAEQNYRIAFATGNHGANSPDGALNPDDFAYFMARFAEGCPQP